MRRRKVVPLIPAMPWGTGYANDEGSCRGLRLGVHFAFELRTMIGWASEVDSKARLNHPVSRIEGGEWACVEQAGAVCEFVDGMRNTGW